MKRLIILAGDIAILYLSLYLTLLVRYREPVTADLWNIHVVPFSLVFLVWITVFFINNLYNLQTARNSISFSNTLVKSHVINAGIALAFFYLTPGDLIDIRPKTNLLLQVVLSGALLVGWRQLFNRTVSSETWAEPVLIVGCNEKTLQLAEEITQHPQFGFRVRCVLPLPGDAPHTAQFEEKIKRAVPSIAFASGSLEDIVTQHRIRTIITTFKPHEYPSFTSQLLSAMRRHVTIFSFSTFYERITGKIPVTNIDQQWFLENLADQNKRAYEIVKRTADIAAASILLVLSIPFVPLIWAAIKIDDPGSSFFMQHRTGKGGKTFLAIKFRTMRKDAERHGPQWAQPNDPRVTRVGRFLRKTRIDEIPQLINVLKGEMSFVGPRPERPEFVAELKKTIPFYDERHMVTPGLTGWAQINFPYGASQKDALEKLQYDLYYIKNRSLALDVSIMLKTVRIILSGAGQ